MIFVRYVIGLCFAVFVCLGLPAFAQNVKPPVVIELFTSEVCGYCPPADEFLGELSEQEGIIALACHVDYFSSARTKMNFEKPFCAQRQSNYVSRNKNMTQKYTPQMIFNGGHEAIGTKPDKVGAAILKARGENIKRLVLSPKSASEYTLILPDLHQGQRPQIDLVLISFRKPQTVTMTSGPNMGQQVTYTNVVHSQHSLGSWDGRAGIRNITSSASPNIGGFAVLAQARGSGKIVAAGSVRR